MKLCKHAFSALYKVTSNHGWKPLETHARNNTRLVHALKRTLPKVHVKLEMEVIPELKLFFKNDALKISGPRPTVLVKNLVNVGTSKDLVEKTVVPPKEIGGMFLLNPGFSNLMTGHTKNDCDMRFNNMKHEYNKTNCFTTEQLIETGNKSEYITAVQVTHEVFVAYSDMFDIIYDTYPVGSIKKYQMFMASLVFGNHEPVQC